MKQLTIADPPRRRSPKRKPRQLLATSAASLGVDDQYFSRTIARALDVLEAFRGGESLSIKQISQLVGLPEPTLFRIALTLEKRQYLRRNPDGSYLLSPRLLFGKLLDKSERLHALGLPELQRLAMHFNETASLAFLIADRVQVAGACESFHEIRISNKVGRILPPHCSAMGKAITAYQAPELMHQIIEVYGLGQRTPRSIVERGELMREFETIRQQGFALDNEESVIGGVCTAAPIRLAAQVRAALSVSVPTVRMNPERASEIVREVQLAAQRLGELWDQNET